MVRRGSVSDVYLHIGLQKTGTSYLQRTLWDSRAALADKGVLVPGTTFNAHTLAAWDLLGRRPKGADLPAVPGSWQALVDQVNAFDGSSAVISHEILMHARPKDVKRIARDFEESNLHMVLTVRDLGRTIGSAWQQELGKGHSWSWADYVAAVREPEKWPPTAGVAFWLRQDPIKILDAWETAVPRERIHIVTLPPPGSPVTRLLERFAAAIAIPIDALTAERPAVNSGVGAVEAEVLRRLNAELDGRLNERQYIHVVQRGVRHGLAPQDGSRPIRLDANELGWVQGWGRELVATLAERGYPISGDLADLIPQAARGEEDHAAAVEVSDAEVADAAMRALVAVTGAYADFWWRARRRDRRSEASTTTKIASWGRSLSFRARTAALELSDRNKLAAKAANRYLHRGRKF
jgi:hypothetical protein